VNLSPHEKRARNRPKTYRDSEVARVRGRDIQPQTAKNGKDVIWRFHLSGSLRK
jgi:hypothetical protein